MFLTIYAMLLHVFFLLFSSGDSYTQTDPAQLPPVKWDLSEEVSTSCFEKNYSPLIWYSCNSCTVFTIKVSQIRSSVSLKYAFYSSFFIKVYINVSTRVELWGDSLYLNRYIIQWSINNFKYGNYIFVTFQTNFQTTRFDQFATMVWTYSTDLTTILNTCCLHYKPSKTCIKNRITAVSKFLINSIF